MQLQTGFTFMGWGEVRGRPNSVEWMLLSLYIG